MIKSISMVAVAMLLTACLSESNTDTPTPTPSATTSTEVTNMANGKTNIVGTWASSCSGSVSGDLTYTEEYSSASLYTITERTFTTTDGSCGGTATITGTRSGSFVIGADVTATSWTDGTAAIAAPTAQDAVTTLPATPVATTITITFSTATGSYLPMPTAPINIMGAVDATVASNLAFYVVYDDGGNGLVADGFDKYTKQ